MFHIRITVLDTQSQHSELHDFRTSPIRIGRHPGNDLVLAFPFISAWHAEVRHDERGVRLCDLGSSNGLVVDGQQLESGSIHRFSETLVATVGHIELHVTVHQQGIVDGRARDRVSAQGSLDTNVRVKADSGTKAIPVHQMHAAVHRLRPLHETLVQARRAFDAAFATEMDAFHATRDQDMIALLREEFSGGWTEVGEQIRLGEILRMVAEIAPGVALPSDVDGGRQLIGAVVGALQTFARGVIALQEGRERQASEMGVRFSPGGNPQLGARTEGDVLRLLLDWREPADGRFTALMDIFSAILAHQRGLANAAVKGGRYITEQLAPSNIERGVQAVWPTRGAALWKRFEEMYETLITGDVSAGARESFAEAYAEEMAKAGIPVRRDGQSSRIAREP